MLFPTRYTHAIHQVDGSALLPRTQIRRRSGRMDTAIRFPYESSDHAGSKEYPMEQTAYPVQFSVDYPDRPLNRLTSAFRIFVAIPILIVLGSVSGGTWEWTSGTTMGAAAGTGGLLFFAPLLMLL